MCQGSWRTIDRRAMLTAAQSCVVERHFTLKRMRRVSELGTQLLRERMDFGERAIPGAGVTDRLFDRQARRCLSFGRAVAWKCSPPIARLLAGRSFLAGSGTSPCSH